MTSFSGFHLSSVLLRFMVTLRASSDALHCTEHMMDISSTQQLLNIFPNEKNVALFLYKDDCPFYLNSSPYFNHLEIDFGPSSITPFTVNTDHLDVDIRSDWNINHRSNCSLILFIPRMITHHFISKSLLIAPSQNIKQLRKWFRSIISSQSLQIINRHHNAIQHILCDYNEQKLKVIAPGTSHRSRVYIGDILLWRDAVDKHLVNWYIVRGFETQSIEVSERNELCTFSEGMTTDQMDDCNALREDEVKRLKLNEWEQIRFAKNRLQPMLMTNFTKSGFHKTRISDGLYFKLKAFFDDQHGETGDSDDDDKGILELNGGSTFNQDEVDNVMYHLPRNLEKLVWNEVGSLMEQWMIPNDLELVISSMYGIRKYQHGAVVKEHVDVCESHIFGAVINVAQSVNQQWPFRIYDHHGNGHEMVMEPQDIVLYESASCIHARPYPLNGDYYANTFVHFKPKGWQCPY